MKLAGRKDIQSAKLAWSSCVQSLKSAPLPLSRGIMKDVRGTYTRIDIHIYTHTKTGNIH